ncbi:acyl-CoA dehydrogenase family protein [Streptomyces sp. KN37]|uniref:acyl-CoA dehydrogenase family protein n=1 Tax=Streptomyces sp. KN37 TaxID=3090667 RepID=UPI002A759C19|nr:acyl-CoA dehydrogenase family protein [Streptomyces sp. KN37]WPO70837.1 acyl-CoA dehydrogenase family protein [Streptomyces sp. KN37]
MSDDGTDPFLPDGTHPPLCDGFRAAVGRALEPLPGDATLPRVCGALGAAGILAGVYRRTGRDGPVADPGRLGALLAATDARGDNGVTLGVLVQTASAVPLLGSAPAGSPAARVYEEALRGATTVALAATDAAAPGSDLAGLGTEVSVIGDELTLTGGKRWATGACVAGHLLVLARHRPGRHFTSFTWVLVPADAPGVEIVNAATDLLPGSATGHIRFDSVRLPADHVIGRQGRAMAAFARHMGTERLAGAQWAVALTGRVLAQTLDVLQGRSVDGVPLWHNDVVRRDFAACLVKVSGLRALYETHARRIVEEQDLAAAALLKSAVGLAADEVLACCAQLQGADGFLRGRAQQIRAEAAVLGIGGGVTGLLLGNVADGAKPLLERLRA